MDGATRSEAGSANNTITTGYTLPDAYPVQLVCIECNKPVDQLYVWDGKNRKKMCYKCYASQPCANGKHCGVIRSCNCTVSDSECMRCGDKWHTCPVHEKRVNGGRDHDMSWDICSCPRP